MNKYVIARVLGNGYKNAYVGLPKSGVTTQVGLYADPNFATVYTNKATAQQILNKDLNFGEWGKVLDFTEAVADWESQKTAGFFFQDVAVVPVVSKKALVLSGNLEEDRRILLKWWLEDYSPTFNNTPADVYSTNNNLTYQVFKYLHFTCYRPQTDQEVVNLRFTPVPKVENLGQMKAEILAALPYIKPIDGVKIFSVLEPSLSAGGSFTVTFNDSTWRLQFGRGSRDSTVISSGNLDYFLKECQERFAQSQEQEDHSDE